MLAQGTSCCSSCVGQSQRGVSPGHGDRLEIPVLPLERRSVSQGKNRCRMFGRDFQVTRVKTPCLISLSILRVLCPTVQPQGGNSPACSSLLVTTCTAAAHCSV